MVEATQVVPWWSSIQIWSYIATVVMGFAAAVMVVISWFQLREALKGKIKVDEALVAANNALDRAQQLEISMEELHYYAFLSDESGTKTTFSGLALIASELEKLGSPDAGNLRAIFRKNHEDATKRYEDFKRKREAELGL